MYELQAQFERLMDVMDLSLKTNIYIYVYTHTYQDRLSVSAETGKEGQWTVAKRQESAGTYSM